ESARVSIRRRAYSSSLPAWLRASAGEPAPDRFATPSRDAGTRARQAVPGHRRPCAGQPGRANEGSLPNLPAFGHPLEAGCLSPRGEAAAAVLALPQWSAAQAASCWRSPLEERTAIRWCASLTYHPFPAFRELSRAACPRHLFSDSGRTSGLRPFGRRLVP